MAGFVHDLSKHVASVGCPDPVSSVTLHGGDVGERKKEKY
jgi:hypothetical protein